MSQNSIEAYGLVKNYGDTRALDGLDLTVGEGTVLGLLGPNGAGKTTAVRLLTTLARPDGGRAKVCGFDVENEPGRIRSLIGVTGQFAAVDEFLTAKENLRLMGRFHHLSHSEIARRTEELLDQLDLGEYADRAVSKFSGGMKRRIDIAMSLMSRPKILFLDEPTTGLDPRSRMGMWELIDQLTSEGMTTLLTTQYLEEADYLCDNIMVIDRGRSIAEGTPSELKETIGGARANIVLADGETSERSIKALGDLAKSELRTNSNPSEISVAIDSETTTPQLVRRLDLAGVEILDISVTRPTLDDVFMELTGKAADEDTAR